MGVLKEAFTELQLRRDLYRLSTREDRISAVVAGIYGTSRREFMDFAKSAAAEGHVSLTAACLLQVGRNPARIEVFSKALSVDSTPNDGRENASKIKRANKWAKIATQHPAR